MSAFLTPLFLILGITYLFNKWMQLITVEKKFWDTEWWKMRLEEVQRPFLEALIHYPVLLCLVAQLCLTFWDPVDCRQPGSSVHGDSPGKNTEVGCYILLLIHNQVSSVQSVSHLWLFVTPWTAARQASLSITNSWSLLKLMSIGVSDAIQTSHPLLSPSLPAFIFPASGTFPMSHFFASDGQTIGASALASVLPMMFDSSVMFNFLQPQGLYPTVVCLSPLSMKLSRQVYWSG